MRKHNLTGKGGPIGIRPRSCLCAATGSNSAARRTSGSNQTFPGEKASPSNSTTSIPGSARTPPPFASQKVSQTKSALTINSSDRDRPNSQSKYPSSSRQQDSPNNSDSFQHSGAARDRGPVRAGKWDNGNDALGRDSTMQAIMAAQDVSALRHALNTPYYPLKVLHLAAAAALLSKLPLEDSNQGPTDTMSRSETPALKLMAILVTEMGRRSRGCDFRAVSNSLGACAKIGYSPDDVTIAALLEVALTPAFMERHCRTAPSPTATPSPGVDVAAAASAPAISASIVSPSSPTAATAASSSTGPPLPLVSASGPALGSLFTVSPAGKSELQQCKHPQEVVNFAYALAVLGILDFADGRVVRLNAGDVDLSSRIDNDGSNSAGISSRLWSSITQAALSLLDICKPQDVSNLVWACAKVGHVDLALLQPLIHSMEADGRMSGFKIQETANLSWGLAKMGIYSPKLFTNCEEMLLYSLLQSSSSASISGLTSGSEGVRSQVFGSRSRSPYALKHKELASLLISFAQVHHPISDACLAAACQYIRAGLLEQHQQFFKPQELSNMMWALSHLDPDSDRTHEVLQLGARQVESDIQKFTGTELSMVSVSLAIASCVSCGSTQRAIFHAAMEGLQQEQHNRPVGRRPDSDSGNLDRNASSDSGADGHDSEGSSENSGTGNGSVGADRQSVRKSGASAVSGTSGSSSNSSLHRGSSIENSSSSSSSSRSDGKSGSENSGSKGNDSRLAMSRWNTQAVTGVVWAGAKTQALSAEDLSHMVPVLVELVPSCNSLELSNLLWAYATCGDYDLALFNAFSRAAETFAPTLQHTDLGRIAWAFSRAGHLNPPLLTYGLANRMLQLLNQAISNDRSSSSSSSSSSTSSSSSSSPKTEGSNRSLSMGMGGSSNSSNSSSSSNNRFGSNIGKLNRNISSRGAFEPQILSNLVWAFARQSYYSEPLSNAISQEIQAQASNMSAIDVSCTLWAYATTQHYDASLMSVLAGRVVELGDRMTATMICRIAWSFAVLVNFDARIFQTASKLVLAALVPQKQTRLQSSKRSQQQQQQQQQQQERPPSNSLNQSSFAQQVLFNQPYDSGLTSQDDSLSLQNLVMLMWSCATVQYHDPALIAATFSSLNAMPLEEFEESAGGIYQAAFMIQVHTRDQDPTASQGYKSDPGCSGGSNLQGSMVVFSDSTPVASPSLPMSRGRTTGSTQSAAKAAAMAAAAAAAVAAAAAATAASAAVRASAAAAAGRSGLFKPTSLSQISDSDTELSEMSALFGSLGVSEDPAIQPGALLAKLLSPERCVIARTANREARVDTTVSSTQRQVFRMLQSLGVSPELEVEVAGGMYSVDIGLIINGQSVAVEVDGPHHFCRNVQNHPLGSTVARDRSLQALCHHLVVVPWFEWNLLRGSEAQKSYLATRLKEVEHARVAGPFFLESGKAVQQPSDSKAATTIQQAGLLALRKKTFTPQITISRNGAMQHSQLGLPDKITPAL